MHSDYKIEDLVFQNREFVIYRAHHHSGIPHAIIRLKFSEEVQANLQKQDRFQNGLEQLLLLDHPNLRKVVEGGLDPIDGHPWLITKWVEGHPLSQVGITTNEVQSLRNQAQDLIVALGYRSGALAFGSSHVVVANAHQGKPLYTFAIDFFSWFRDWAIGYPPGEKNNPHQALDTLINSLNPTQAEPRPPQKNQASPLKANIPTMLVTSTLPTQTFKPKNESTPVEQTPAAALPPQTTTVTIPSTDHKPLKPILLVGSLILLIVAGVLWINTRSPQPSPTADSSENAGQRTSGEKPRLEKKNTEPPSPVPPPETLETPVPVTTSNTPPERPEFAGEMLDVNTSDKDALEDAAGQWVVLLGTTSKTTQNRLTFEDSLVKAHLPEDLEEISPGQKVKITGYLKNSTQIVVEAADDLVVEVPLDTVYTVEDEEKLRGMNQAHITLRAKVADFTKTKTGSTLYLVFHEEGPGFRAGISPSRAEDDIDEDYLRTFVGKEITVAGTVTTFERASGGRGNRLVIRFTKKSDIGLIDE